VLGREIEVVDVGCLWVAELLDEGWVEEDGFPPPVAATTLELFEVVDNKPVTLPCPISAGDVFFGSLILLFILFEAVTAPAPFPAAAAAVGGGVDWTVELAVTGTLLVGVTVAKLGMDGIGAVLIPVRNRLVLIVCTIMYTII
jgi:hypothetical protein